MRQTSARAARRGIIVLVWCGRLLAFWKEKRQQATFICLSMKLFLRIYGQVIEWWITFCTSTTQWLWFWGNNILSPLFCCNLSWKWHAVEKWTPLLLHSTWKHTNFQAAVFFFVFFFLHFSVSLPVHVIDFRRCSFRFFHYAKSRLSVWLVIAVIPQRVRNKWVPHQAIACG